LNQARGTEAAHNLQAQAKSGDRAKIEKAARDFESILVGKWLEDAEKSFATVPGDDPDEKQDSGHDQYQSLAIQSLASGLTKSGGLGIAAMIVKRL
jgi:Rod binding domain-containing protein